jgi:predicted nucleic acid-binding protein
MPVFYLDTSALVKRYRTEPGTEVVEELFAGAPPGDEFFISFLSIIELTSAVLRLVKGASSASGPHTRYSPGSAAMCGT